MQLSDTWLRACLKEAHLFTTSQFAEALTGAGIEVESLLPVEDKQKGVMMELKVPANRGDCLGVLGITRELSALFRIPYQLWDKPLSHISGLEEILGEEEAFVQIQAQAQKACPLYYMAAFDNLPVDAKTPDWIQARLAEAGLSLEHPIVDILNYVMLELGQPLHAFDSDALQGKLHLRLSQPGETLTLLNQSACTLPTETLVLADDQGPLALSGILGGARAAIKAQTRRFILESAYFDPICIRLTARKTQIRTEAVQRFERGVDPAAVKWGFYRAIELITQHTGATCLNKHLLQMSGFPVEKRVHLSLSEVEAHLGMALPETVCEDSLSRLGFGVKILDKSTLEVLVPSHRSDVNLAVDLIEEILRLQGLDALPARMPKLRLQATKPSALFKAGRHIQSVLSSRGYQEQITYSFLPKDKATAFHDDETSLSLINPISREMAVMRRDIVPGLLLSLQHHQRHHHKHPVRFFEWGRVFHACQASEQEQPYALGMLVQGSYLSGWNVPNMLQEAFSLKADLESILGQTELIKAFSYQQPAQHPALHPKESAALVFKGKHLGYIGALHPRLYPIFDIEGPVYVLSLQMIEALAEALALPKRFKPFSRLPVLSRDLSLSVPPALSAQTLLDAIQTYVKAQLKDVRCELRLFDLYEAKSSAKPTKSLGLNLRFQAEKSPLQDDTVNTCIQGLLQELQTTHAVTLRA